jgi:hypothetical protein
MASDQEIEGRGQVRCPVLSITVSNSRKANTFLAHDDIPPLRLSLCHEGGRQTADRWRMDCMIPEHAEPNAITRR